MSNPETTSKPIPSAESPAGEGLGARNCSVFEVSVQYQETRERVFSVEAESHEAAKDLAAELMADQYAEAPCVAWSVHPYQSRRMDDEKCSSPNDQGQLRRESDNE